MPRHSHSILERQVPTGERFGGLALALLLALSARPALAAGSFLVGVEFGGLHTFSTEPSSDPSSFGSYNSVIALNADLEVRSAAFIWVFGTTLAHTAVAETLAPLRPQAEYFPFLQFRTGPGFDFSPFSLYVAGVVQPALLTSSPACAGCVPTLNSWATSAGGEVAIEYSLAFLRGGFVWQSLWTWASASSSTDLRYESNALLFRLNGVFDLWR